MWRVGLGARGGKTAGPVGAGRGAGGGRAFQAYEIAAGEDLRDPEDLLVSESVARELQLELGDELEISRSAPRVQGCVGGEIVTVGDPAPPVDQRTFRITGILAPL